MKKLIALFVLFSFVAVFADNPHFTHLIELMDVAISSPADGDVLTFDSASSKWVNKPSSRPVHLSFINHVGSMDSTVLFTPPSDGEYMVSVYFEDISRLGQAQCTTLSWTDDVRFQSDGGQCAQAPFFASTTTRMLHVKAATPISISVTDFSSSTPQTFSMYATVEQL